jgi:hypothetical protein
VASVTTSKEPPSIRLAAKYPSRAELSAARAAVVSNRIDEDCPVEGGALRSTAWVDDSTQKVAGVKLPAVVFQVRFPPDAP